MKRILVILLLLISFTSLHAQEKENSNVLRAGTSLLLKRNYNFRENDKVFAGIQFQLEYSRKFTSYFSLDASFFKSNIKYSYLNNYSGTLVPQFSNSYFYGVSVNGIFTPFKAIKWLKLGFGGFAEYSIDYNSAVSYESYLQRQRNNIYGINIPIRFYIIDSSKFDLYAYYEYEYTDKVSGADKDASYFLNDAFGLMFGVKF